MKRLIKIIGLIYLGTRLEHLSQVLLVKHGFAEVDQYGRVHKSKNWDKRVDEIVGRISDSTFRKTNDGTY